jgi:hypothetical protein
MTWSTELPLLFKQQLHNFIKADFNPTQATSTVLSNSPSKDYNPTAIMAATDGTPVIKVLFTLHAGMDAMDFIGPLEVLTHAQHNINDACKSNDQSRKASDHLLSIRKSFL